MDFNQWIGEGNISHDPELRTTNDNNRSVTNFFLFIDNTYKSKRSNEVIYKKRSSKIPIVAWAGKAELIAKNFKKGDKVRLVGKLRTRQATTKDGIVYTAFEIVAENISLISRVD